jgi:arsenite-transporting ATPase
MRILLFTGKGGVGKTTVAAATAARAAASGLRTIVVSTDPAHSLADAFDVELDDRPSPVAADLWGQQLNARLRFEETWDDIRRYMVDVLDWVGADALVAEELAVVPGLDEVFSLADIKQFATSGDYDLVVDDCAPTAETIRLLSLPDVLGWYMDRVFDAQRRLTRLARPVLSRVSGIPVAGDQVFGAIRRFYDRLAGVRELLTDGAITSARLVVNPERLVVAEARRTYTYLSLFGYHVDGVVVNRILPTELDHPWLDQWKNAQSAHLDAIADAFGPLPILTAELAERELVGVSDLRNFADDLYGDLDVAARLSRVEPLRVDAVGDSLVLSVHVPFTDRDDVRLGRTEQELFVSVGPHRRALLLPDSLLRREVGRAHFEGDRLEVEFV